MNKVIDTFLSDITDDTTKVLLVFPYTTDASNEGPDAERMAGVGGRVTVLCLHVQSSTALLENNWHLIAINCALLRYSLKQAIYS